MSSTCSQKQDEAYKLHPDVINDIDQITDYIANDSLQAARPVAGGIFDMIESLVPIEIRHRGHRRHDLTDLPLLFVPVYDYLIAYAPDENPMYIIACILLLFFLASAIRISYQQ